MYYQVEGSNLRVLGTMHGFPVENTNMPSWVWDGFNWCEDLVFEAPDPRYDTDFDSVATLPKGTTLKQLMSPKSWRELKAIVPEHKKDKLLYLKPWVAFIALGEVLLKQFEGVEIQFRKRLCLFPKPVTALETNRITAQGFEVVPWRDYVKMLEFSLQNRILVQKMFFDEYEAWVGGRIEDFENTILRDPLLAIVPRYRDGMTVARNKNWMHSFKLAFPSSRKILFAVGAGHLFGEGGLTELFAKEKHPLISLIPKQ
jgi:uncharacterized protein YbaP (TraB family)